MNNNIGWQFDNSYARLPNSLYARLNPVPVHAPHLAILNEALAESLGLNLHSFSEQDAALLFAGNTLPDGAQPIAQAYAGHQFGNFTILGDGRAILLGEHVTPTNERFDIQLKGSGQTPFSRQGDGRAAIAPMLREYIISEAVHALNIPTTRSLAVVTTGEPVIREMALPGAILTRVAASHIRVGTFEYLVRTGKIEELKILADHVIQRHYPDLSEADNPYLALLTRVIDRQASLVAKWLLVGFIHGVMNTDNMTISGETIDYGPCAFMDTYDPNTVFSSIDHYGRYRYSKQPDAAQWNLARFAETLLPLLHPTQEQAIAMAEKAIHAFPEIFQNYWLAGMRKKLGLFTEEAEDSQLFEILLTWMQGHQADYTHTFHALASASMPTDTQFNNAAFIEWYTRWQARLLRQPNSKASAINLMLANNPAIIPRNHLVEEALIVASEQGDYTRVHQLHAAITNPYADIPEYDAYHMPPPPSDRIYQTFCGT